MSVTDRRRAAVNNSKVYQPTLKMWANWLYRIKSNQTELNLAVFCSGELLNTTDNHRRSQGGAVGAPAPPQGGEKKIFFRPNLQGKCVSAPLQDTKCTPQPEQESILGVFAGW